MKPGFIDKEMMHTPEGIAETNARIKELCAKILPRASEAFKAALADDPEMLEKTGYIDQRCGDLAIALACLWDDVLLGFPRGENLRLAAGRELLGDLNAGCHSKNAKAVELVASRYYLKAPDAAKILECLVP